MFERFTERARQVVVLAQESARNLKHDYIGTEHILLGLVREEEGLAARALDHLGVTEAKIVERLLIEPGEGGSTSSGQIPFTPRAKYAFELALREALACGHNYIGTEHVLLGLMRGNEGRVVRLITELGTDTPAVRDEVMRRLTGTLDGGTHNSARWEEYVICRKRGHEARNPSLEVGRQLSCMHCGTTFWSEMVVREKGAPVDPSLASGEEER